MSVCARKQRFADAEDAKVAALTATVELRYYRCDRCFCFHLTSRTKGKRVLFTRPDRGRRYANGRITQPGNGIG